MMTGALLGPASRGPADDGAEQTSLLSNGGWILVVHGLALVGLCVFLVWSSVAKQTEDREAYLSLAAPIETALNARYDEDIAYTRAYGREYPSSRFYTFTETLTVDGLPRADCTLSYRDLTPEGSRRARVADVALSCAIKPVHETRGVHAGG